MQAEVDEMDAQVKRFGDEQANLEASLPLAPRLTLMEAASPPVWPTLDKKVKAAGGAFLGLFGLVFLGVAVLEFRTHRVYKSDDVSQGLGLPLMGTVPTVAAPARAAAPVADDEALGPMIESMAAIRTMLLHAGRSETLRVLMVASAVSGEGKTSLASNLAASLARGGRRTLLVDGDLRNPAVHQIFNLPAGPGFAELLRGEVEPAHVVQNTTLDNLSVLAAGVGDRRAVQALAQEGVLRTVLDELKEQFDFLIVDVCPVLPVADALLIGEHADAVLLSVMRNPVGSKPRNSLRPNGWEPMRHFRVYGAFPGEGASYSSVIPSTCGQVNLSPTQCQVAGTGLDIGSFVPGTVPRGTIDPTFSATLAVVVRRGLWHPVNTEIEHVGVRCLEIEPTVVLRVVIFVGLMLSTY